MAAKIIAAQNRLYRNTFVCKQCKHKIRVAPLKILTKQVKCRKCAGRDFRPVSRK